MKRRHCSGQALKPLRRSTPRAPDQDLLADAQRQAQEVICSAQQEVESVLARAAAEAEAVRRQRLDLAQAQAAHRRELLLASVPVEVRRLRAARLEKLLHSVYHTVRQRLLAREGFDYREALVALAAEAVSQMQGDGCVIKLSPEDFAALAEGLAKAIAQRVGRAADLYLTFTPDPSITEGGLMIEDRAGQQVTDNRLLVRLERLWPELRRGIVAGAALESPSA